jgi:hypothetical protein
MKQVVWHGTADEALALLAVVNEHCTCRRVNQRVMAVCPTHVMLSREQRAIDGLLFMRRMAERLIVEEFSLDSTQSRASPTSAETASLSALQPDERFSVSTTLTHLDSSRTLRR